jgi:aspartate aminotransferase
MTIGASDAANRVAAFSQRPAKRPGPEVVSLASGDPSFATPDFIGRAMTEAIEAGHTHYVDGQGDGALRTALSARLSLVAGRQIADQQILITHGANSGLAAATIATINPGDRVLIPEPTYSLYADLVRMVGGTPEYVAHLADGHLDLDAIESAAAGAAMVVICHPNNPTGVVYRRDELERLATIAERHDLLVLSDEAYDRIVFDGVDFTSTLELPALAGRLIYCQTLSKTWAMTGWRLGYTISPTEVAGAIARIHRTLNGPMNAAVQKAAAAAVASDSDWPEEARREYQARRELVFEYLAGIPGVEARQPDGTFYVFVKYDHAIPSSELAARALAEGVAIRAGSEYGPSGEGHFRIAFSGNRDDVRTGMERLRTLLASLSR